jgi:sortase A
VNSTTRSASARRWRLVGYAGEILLTLGVVVLLFVVYQLWWTNVAAGQEAARAASQVQQQWSAEAPRPTATATAGKPKVGTTFGLVYIPRLRSKVWGLPLVQGVAAAQLAQGIGHYPATAMPGEIGNFATAGHRATNGEPLRNIDLLEKGDMVVVETETDWFTYQLDRYKIVQPEDVWVIDPVPGKPGATPTQALITLTSCHPRWASYQRYIWWGHLVDATPKSEGKPPAMLKGN